MKTTILLAFVILFFSPVLHAQLEKGKLQIGGSIGFNHQTYQQTPVLDNHDYSNFAASVSAGKFYADNKLAGAFLNYAYYENTSDANQRQYLYGAGVFLRQYKPLLKSLYLFAEESAGYNYNYATVNNKDKLSTVSLSLMPGIAYSLTKHLQVEIDLSQVVSTGYQHAYGNASLNKSDTYYFNTSLNGGLLQNIGYGFRFNLK